MTNQELLKTCTLGTACITLPVLLVKGALNLTACDLKALACCIVTAAIIWLIGVRQ